MTTINFRSLSGLIRYTKAVGSHFFDKGTVQFFNSIAEDFRKVDANRGYIVTSEQYENHPREYSVRAYQIDPQSQPVIDFHIVTRFNTLREAVAYMREAI